VVKTPLKMEDETDLWDEMSAEDQVSIDESLKQLDSGQFVDHQSVRDKIKNRFNF
jgi:hypothetical protein